MVKDVKKRFIRIFALSLAVTLLLSPARPFSCSEDDSFITEVRAEDVPITDTQRGVALLMTIILSQGLRFVGDWDTVVQPGLEKLWNDFSTATGNAVTLPMIVAGSSLALGYIRTSNTVNNAIANFMAWYKQTYSQPTTGDVSVPVSTEPGSFVNFPAGCTLAFFNNTNRAKYADFSGVTRAVILGASVNAMHLYFVSDSPFQYNISFSSSCGTLANPTAFIVNDVTYYVVAEMYNINNFRSDYSFPYYNVTSSTANAISYTYGTDAVIGDVSMQGQSLELKDGYQLESDQAKLYDIAGLEALVASLALTLENIDDLVRDIPLIFDTPWAEDFPDVPAYVDTPDDTIPWVDVPDSVIPADTPEYVPTIPSERDEYKVLGLDQVFPFSIPFDLYYLTQILVHEPETPSFTFAMVNPVNGQLITEELDLSDFDGIASIARTIETILFIAFLIFVTRGLIRS